MNGVSKVANIDDPHKDAYHSDNLYMGGGGQCIFVHGGGGSAYLHIGGGSAYLYIEGGGGALVHTKLLPHALTLHKYYRLPFKSTNFSAFSKQ